MEEGLRNIIRNSSFAIHEGVYVYAKAKTPPPLEKAFLIAKDKDEITVVATLANLKGMDVFERNKDDYRLIELKVSIPFYSVGFLAAVSDAIAKRGMNILIVSTYSKDYVLVRHDLVEKARAALLELGFSEDGNV